MGIFLTYLLASVLIAQLVSQIATFATTIYLHRTATHRSLDLHPAVKWIFKLVLWITTGQVDKEWAAVHRKHHAHTDEEGDPHSPLVLGFWKVQLGNAWLYIKEKNNPETIRKYAPDFEEGWWDKYVFNHGWAGLLVGISLLCWILGVGWGLFAALIHTVTYVGILTACVNAIGHYPVKGAYQNYTGPGAVTTYNYKLLSRWSGGEGNHNNHHGQQRSAKLSHREDECDPAWHVIVLLEKLGLAKNVRRPKFGQAAS